MTTLKEKIWGNVRVPQGLVEEIEKYLASADAKKRGFTSVSQFVAHSLRKELNHD